MRSSFLIRCLAIVAAAMAVPAGRVLADRSDGCGSAAARRARGEVVLYVPDDAGAIAGARAQMQQQYGVGQERFARRITGADGQRNVALVFRTGLDNADPTGDRTVSVWCRTRAVEVNVNMFRRARGAPTQIPVLDGDLEPRSVNTQSAVNQLALPAAQMRASNGPVVVAVLDGGFDLTHGHLAGHVHPAKWDVVDDDPDPQDLGNNIDDDGDGVPDSIVGHGTFVSSLILAGAPNAMILPIRVLDDEGWGSEMAVAMGIQRAVDAGASVINMSLTVPAASQMVRDAVTNALDRGVPIIIAAGNDPQWQNDPRIAGRIVVVGAVDENDQVAPFSNTGFRISVYAPGVNVIGALGGRVPNSYARWSGTSFSAPWVTGAVALGRASAPLVAPHAIRQLAIDDVDPLTGTLTSRGRLDAAQFINAILAQ